MKYSFVIAIVAALTLMMGCSASPSSNRYIEADGPTIEPIQTASEQPTQTEASQPDVQVESPKVEATQQDEKATEQPPEKTSAPTKKPTQSQKLQEAKKSNESLSKAVTDSIMDNGTDKTTVNEPEAAQLIKSIEQIRTLIKDLKQLAESNDTPKMKTVSAQIVQNWDEMKAAVEASYPDMVEFLQEEIDQLNELLAAEEIDSKAMVKLDYELYQAFRQLADKAGV